ncbi:MAG: DUF4838 domain-containing protein [Lentisphaeria bacterium]|nr:DUF4838 domain-containing protein [Lentisphaeria bacterium]
MKRFACMYLVIGAILFASPLYGAVKFSRGEKNIIVVTGKNPAGSVKFAASELARFLGAALKSKVVVQEQMAEGKCIVLGSSGKADAAENVIEEKDGKLWIYGKDTPGGTGDVSNLYFNVENKGTLEAVYQFLEDYVGVRFLEPGRNGTFVTGLKAVTFSGIRKFKPSFDERRCFYFRSVWYRAETDELKKEFGGKKELMLWALRLRFTSERAKVYGCHTPGYLYLEKILFPKKPELFAVQSNGMRSGKDLCWSNPDVEDFWYTLVDCYFRGDPDPKAAGLDLKEWNRHLFKRKDEFMLDPHDYQEYFCQCKRCVDFRRPHGERGQGELVWKVIINVCRRIAKKHPGKYISTLLYPPKRFYPVKLQIPGNLRVRTTIPWQAIDVKSSYFAESTRLLKETQDKLARKGAIWFYFRAAFAASPTLYGVPEVAAADFQKYLQSVKPYVSDVFYEHIEPSHTIRNIDAYLIAHTLYDADLDMNAVADEYFRLYFGKAAPEMMEFYRGMETNWRKVTAHMGGVAKKYPGKRPPCQLNYIFTNIYTYKEIMRLSHLLDKAEKAVPAKSVYAARIRRYRTYVMDLVKQEFSVHTSDRAHSFKPEYPLMVRQVSDMPDAAMWKTLPRLALVNANNKGGKYTQKGSFKVAISAKAIYVKADFDDVEIAKSGSKARKNCDHTDISFDNCSEIFTADAKGKVTQIFVTDLGAFVVRQDKQWLKSADGIKVSAYKSKQGWGYIAEIRHTLTGIVLESGKSRFNLTRTRNLNDKSLLEHSTFNPDAVLGKWTSPARMSAIVPVKGGIGQGTVYQNAAKAPTAGKSVIFLDSKKRNPNTLWVRWNPPKGRSKLGSSSKDCRTSGAAYFIDCTHVPLQGKELTASWRYMGPVPRAGTVLRVSVWTRVESSNPEAVVSVRVAWNDKNKRWLRLKSDDITGTACKRVVPGKWEKIMLEIEVPEHKDIAFVSVTVSGSEIRPGKLFIDDLKIEKVEI